MSPRRSGTESLPTFQASARPMPVIKTGKALGEAVRKLKQLSELLESGTPSARCLVRLGNGQDCPSRPISSHSIQRKLLHRLASDGYIKTFPTQLPAILHRLIAPDRKHLVGLFRKGVWPIDDIAVTKSATRRFACYRHDNQTFGPIERSCSDLMHPLHSKKLTQEHYFLLCYRILLMETETNNGIERLWPEVPRPVRRDRRFRDEAERIMRTAELQERMNQLFSSSYLDRQIHRVIDTPIDVEITLPTQVTMANTFDNAVESRIGEVFLTMFPTDLPADPCEGYRHRFIASQVRDARPSAQKTISAIGYLIDEIREDSAGSEAFLLHVVGASMNVYFSFDYEQHLPARLRSRLEHRFGSDTLAGLQALIPSLAPRKVTKKRRA